MTYIRFFAMIATSTVVMFILMYLNTYLLSHIFWSETRAYMAVLMGATMSIIMLGFMLSMYSSKAINAASLFELDNVIDPAETRDWILKGLRSAPPPPKREGKKRPWIDTW